MQTTLTREEARRLDDARAAVLAADAASDEDGWGVAVTAVLARLVRAGGARLALQRGRACRVYGDDVGGPLHRAGGSAGTGAAPCDRLWWRPAGPGAGACGTVAADPRVVELAIREGAYGTIGFTAEFGVPGTWARVQCDLTPPRDAAQTARGLVLLRLLLPALSAAARSRAFGGVPREALRRLLDAMAAPALLASAHVGAPHANGALARALAADPALHAELTRLARAVLSGDSGPNRPGHAAARELSTPHGRYLLRPSVLHADAGGAATIVAITVEAAPRPAPHADQIHHGFGLTSREAEVTRLLAVGMPNARIAAALGISAATARHHTERVLDKLGTHSRAAVHAILHGRPA